ncbi:hypothetical protein [Streptomyces flaveolus]|uniref:hypothetical protein n=1 Tax=Streptomyces flaveolus TaxID=67297 RepID=UPI00167113F4|nr:hypothetical protein [Streptomyces flaveolus]GGQ81187.1 hypothetical protein GCM10010216_48790 [Streptomyces flaveolus]
MPNPLTPEQAAELLAIPEEDVETFVRLVDALRTPDARAAETARLRAELDAVNDALHDGGVDYPQGAAGVRDLAAALQLAKEDAEPGEYRMSTRPRGDGPADDGGGFVDDFTSGRPD